ncbi:MAG TPA: hypothetical protein VKE40_00660 [Gemmataceae bacterium]|nr:hypothetical protein [Gemmataceae bacterium]
MPVTRFRAAARVLVASARATDAPDADLLAAVARQCDPERDLGTVKPQR